MLSSSWFKGRGRGRGRGRRGGGEREMRKQLHARVLACKHLQCVTQAVHASRCAAVSVSHRKSCVYMCIYK